MTAQTAIAPTVTENELIAALHGALYAAQDKALEPWPHGEGSCGFAWTVIKMRKNGRLHKVLKDFGFTWDGYAKAWTYRACNHVKMHPGTLWQSIDYREAIERAFVAYLSKRVDVIAQVYTRID